MSYAIQSKRKLQQAKSVSRQLKGSKVGYGYGYVVESLLATTFADPTAIAAANAAKRGQKKPGSSAGGGRRSGGGGGGKPGSQGKVGMLSKVAEEPVGAVEGDEEEEEDA